jgi:hypothetical protein
VKTLEHRLFFWPCVAALYMLLIYDMGSGALTVQCV